MFLKLADKFHRVNLLSNIYEGLFIIKILYLIKTLFSHNTWLTLFMEPLVLGYLVFVYLKFINILKPRDGNPMFSIALMRALQLLLKITVFLETQINYKYLLISLAIELVMCFLYLYDVEEYSQYVDKNELNKLLDDK